MMHRALILVGLVASFDVGSASPTKTAGRFTPSRVKRDFSPWALNSPIASLAGDTVDTSVVSPAGPPKLEVRLISSEGSSNSSSDGLASDLDAGAESVADGDVSGIGGNSTVSDLDNEDPSQDSSVSSEDNSDGNLDEDGGTDGWLIYQPFKVTSTYNLTVISAANDTLPPLDVLASTYADAQRYAETQDNSSATDATFEDPFVWLGPRLTDERVVGLIERASHSGNLTWYQINVVLSGLRAFLNASDDDSSNLLPGQKFQLIDTTQNTVVAIGYFTTQPTIAPTKEGSAAPKFISMPLPNDLQLTYDTRSFGGPIDPVTMVEQLNDSIAILGGGRETTVSSSSDQPFNWITHTSPSNQSGFNLMMRPQTSIPLSVINETLNGILNNVANAGYYVGGSFAVVGTDSSGKTQQTLLRGILSGTSVANYSALYNPDSPSAVPAQTSSSAPALQTSSLPLLPAGPDPDPKKMKFLHSGSPLQNKCDVFKSAPHPNPCQAAARSFDINSTYADHVFQPHKYSNSPGYDVLTYPWNPSKHGTVDPTWGWGDNGCMVSLSCTGGCQGITGKQVASAMVIFFVHYPVCGEADLGNGWKVVTFVNGPASTNIPQGEPPSPFE